MPDETVHQCEGCGTVLCSHDVNWGMGKSLCLECFTLAERRHEEEADTVECVTCGQKTRSWTRKQWRDGRLYFLNCFNSSEEVWLAERSCMLCGELIGDCDKKVKPPKRIMEGDKYVKDGSLQERYVCFECFKRHSAHKGGMSSLITPVTNNSENKTLAGKVAGAISCLFGGKTPV